VTAPLPKGRGFPIQRPQPVSTYVQTGFTQSPRADAASPAAKILRAALMSLSCIAPHSGHTHSRTFKGIFVAVYPQLLHLLLEGKKRSMPISVRPDHSDLYSSCRINSPHPASEIDFARKWFFCMFLTASVSMAITWFSLTSLVESLCRKSLRVSAVLACNLAIFRLALRRFAEPRCFFAIRCCNLASLASFLRYVFGAAIFSPVERMAKCVRPRSIPILPATDCLAETVSSHSIETKYRPAASFVTVTDVSFAAFGMMRENLMASGSFIFASFKALPSQLKPLCVYLAACLSFFDLKYGYLQRSPKKLLNAVCRWRSDCCNGTLDTSFSHANSGCFFNSVSKLEVSW